MFGLISKKRILKKINHYLDIDGWLTEQEALGLYIVAHKLPSKSVVVEIGSWQGKSTYCIGRGLKSGNIFCIDPFNADGGMDVRSQEEYNYKGHNKDLLLLFLNNMEKDKVIEKVVVRQGYSRQFPADFEKINFLFIDGDHSQEGCTLDFELYSKKVVKGGFIAFHDYYSDRKELGPTYVIENLLLPQQNFIFYKQFDSLWVGRKIK